MDDPPAPALIVWLNPAAPLATSPRGEAPVCRRWIASILGGLPLVTSIPPTVIIIAAATFPSLSRALLIVAADPFEDLAQGNVFLRFELVRRLLLFGGTMISFLLLR